MPEKVFKIVTFFFILLSLIPAYYINLWLQKFIRPRRHFGLFLLYVFSCFALVFAYTFLVTAVVFKVFPLPKR